MAGSRSWIVISGVVWVLPSPYFRGTSLTMRFKNMSYSWSYSFVDNRAWIKLLRIDSKTTGLMKDRTIPEIQIAIRSGRSSLAGQVWFKGGMLSYIVLSDDKFGYWVRMLSWKTSGRVRDEVGLSTVWFNDISCIVNKLCIVKNKPKSNMHGCKSGRATRVKAMMNNR